jgi:VPDSG-CTERM motif
MKSFKYIATLTLAIAGLTTHVDAIPITYSYIGANFTSVFGPTRAGFTTSDNITASFTVNNFLAPSMTFTLTSIGATMATISNGVYTLGLGGIVTTDASGNIAGWDFNEQTPPAIDIVRLTSFRDEVSGIAGDSAEFFTIPETGDVGAFNSVSGTWSSGPASVPDEGATLALLGVALAGVEVLRRKGCLKRLSVFQ